MRRTRLDIRLATVHRGFGAKFLQTVWKRITPSGADDTCRGTVSLDFLSPTLGVWLFGEERTAL